MLPFTEADVRREIDDAYLERGRRYHASGRVGALALHDQGTRITASISGTQKRPYRVEIHVERHRRGASIEGECSCPVGFNCKHVAAALLAALMHNPPAAAAPVAAPPIDYALQEWLKSLDYGSQSAAAPAAQDESLLYLLKLDRAQRRARVAVEIIYARALKAGGYGKAERWNGGLMSHARYVSETDRDILRWLEVLKHDHPGGGLGSYYIGGGAGATVLARLLASGRCHWLSKDTPALRPGEPRRGTPAWRADEHGVQHIVADGAGEVTAVLPLTPPWYVDTARAHCGELITGLPDAFAATLFAAPRLAPEQAAAAHATLRRHFAEGVPALPAVFEETRSERPVPVPVLRLFRQSLALDYLHQWKFAGARVDVELADLGFDYAGTCFNSGDEREAHTRLEAGALVRTERDRAREFEAMGELFDAGFAPLDEFEEFSTPPKHCRYAFAMDGQDRAQRLLAFAIERLPRLRAQGWRIDVAPDSTYRIAEAGDDWYADLDAGAQADWFGLELGVTVDGERVNLLPLLLNWLGEMRRARHNPRALAENETVLARLPDGRLLPIPYARVRQVLAVLTELYDERPLDVNGKLKLSRGHAGQLAALADDFGARLAWSGAERLRELAERVRGFAGLAPAAAPKGLHAELRPYQREGLAWLQFLREFEFGGVLADDMGLGKTVQTLAHLQAEKNAGRLDRPALVVAPTSVLPNWRREAQTLTPALRVLTLHGAQRKQDFARLAAHDIVLTSYALLARDTSALLAQRWHTVVLDEAQAIKNPRAQAAITACALETRHRLCLTGTPMENHLGELWSLFHFLMPGWLGDEKRFRRLYRTPIEKHADEERRAALARRLKPFLLRRTKEQVATELPPKNEIVQTIELDGAQRDLYESIRVALQDKVRREVEKHGLARSQIVILDALLKLRQVCCDPRLLKLEAAKKVKHSAKLEALLDMLPELIEEGRRVLLFSQFTSMLDLIEPELAKRAIAYTRLSGETRDRAKPVERFQSGAVPLFLVSLKAGGTGLNLTAADTVIHYDPWWNPAVERQATDRAHRIGQDKTVFVYKLITQGTVEEKIAALQARKQALADGVYGEAGAGGAAFTAEDLESLFRET